MDVYEVTRGPRKGYYRRGTDERITREQFHAALDHRPVLDAKEQDRIYVLRLRERGDSDLAETEVEFLAKWGEDA